MSLIKVYKSESRNGQIEVQFTVNKLIFLTINKINEAEIFKKILPTECTELYINLTNIKEIDSCGLALLIQLKKHYPVEIKVKISDKCPAQLEKLKTLYFPYKGLL